ncbi:Uncharacterised protein [Mycobacteroides abscessus subsp. bolletii]|nr:Uncharacterised protein [Mycobacteroides abscessus subsp. bolletii]SHZ08711.1 Uncharacterised protein [Mycobacteroides abscessus subsp. bolletii]
MVDCPVASGTTPTTVIVKWFFLSALARREFSDLAGLLELRSEPVVVDG